MRLRQTGAVTPPSGRKALNVEHRTPNIERRILMTLRFIDFITSRSQKPPAGKIRSVVSLPAFVATSAKQAYAVFFFDRIPCSMLDVQCSMFDVHLFYFSTPHMADISTCTSLGSLATSTVSLAGRLSAK